MPSSSTLCPGSTTSESSMSATTDTHDRLEVARPPVTWVTVDSSGPG
ncbi:MULTISPECIES: hypothetical protein [Streptomyces]